MKINVDALQRQSVVCRLSSCDDVTDSLQYRNAPLTMIKIRGGKNQWFFKLEIWFFGFYGFLGLSLESQK